MPATTRHRHGFLARIRRGLVLLALLSAGCARNVPPLEQEAYVWQRVWTPAVVDAVKNAPADFSALRVLVAELRADGEFETVSPALPVLAQSGLPVIAVVRIDGQLAPASSLALRAVLDTVQQQFRATGVALRGVEIDHDCASARLPQYTALLIELRQALPHELRLSITALPAWLQSDALAPLLAAVDEAVLQVHAVENPTRGLFAPAQAARWIAAFAARSDKPFRVALPAYGSRVDWDAQGRIVAVTSEAAQQQTGTEQRELSADPREVAVLLQQLRRDPPPPLAGIVWFRLPTADDQRAWRIGTLHAVISGAPLHAELHALLRPRETPALYDLLLENRGNLDAELPAAVRAEGAGCDADALGAYVIDDDPGATSAGILRWKLQRPARVAAGQQRIIGWLRCGRELSGSVVHVEP